MNIIVEKNYEQMSRTSMNHLFGLMYGKKPVHLAITAGSTPKRMYELMVEEMKEKKPLEHVTYYNFDEIPIKGGKGYGVTMGNLSQMYFQPAHIPDSQIHILDEFNYEKHDEYIDSIGGLDAILIGIGADGHYCGNLPHLTKFSDRTTRVDISSELRERLSGEFNGDISKVPEFYVTMGPRSVMNIKKIIMFASGIGKAEIIKKAFFGPVSEEVPSSIFQLHPNFTLILDEDAASLIQECI